MSRLYNTFEFIGNVVIPKSKEKFHEVKTSDSGWEGHRLNFSMQESKTNSVFLEVYGGFNTAKANKVFSFSKGTENNKGGKLEIPWEDRLNPETLDMVADFKKLVVDFTTDQELKEKVNQLRYEIRTLEYKDELTPEEQGKLGEKREELLELAPDRHEFISEYDAVQFLSENLEKYKAHKLRITGRVEYNEWKGKFHRKFKPELIEVVDSETPNQLRATMDIFFTEDSLDEADFKKEKKLYINGYVIDYDGKAKKDVFFPQQFILNAQKVDLENEGHVKRLNFLKNKFVVKGKGVYHLQWLVNIFRGAESVEFTEKDLTASQREAIEFGLNKLEDFAPKGGMLGENFEETKLVKPILQKINDSNDFSEGAVESSYDAEDLVFVSQTTITNEIQPEKKSETKIDPNIEKELDDLFG